MESKYHLVIIALLLTTTFITTNGQIASTESGMTDNQIDYNGTECLPKDRLWMDFNYNCSLDEEANSDVILIGYLGSFNLADDGFGNLISGAIPEAIERINK